VARFNRPSRRRSFRSPSGRVAVRWRWEVGLPLIVVGTLMAYTVADVEGGDVFFWVGTLIAGIGVAVFFAGRFSR
jgi:hypothetical protein